MPKAFSPIENSHYHSLTTPLYELLHQYLKGEQPFRKAHQFSVHIVESLAHAGKFEQSIEIAEGIKVNRHKSNTLSSIAKSLAQTGEFEWSLSVA